MKRLCLLILSLALPLAAFAGEEDQLLAALQSGQSLQEKDAACARLKWIGATKSIPALAQLLTDADLSHTARYALESMPGPEAERALLEALKITSGSNEIGVINSLGVRADGVALPELAALLRNPDPDRAAPAAHAIGQIGGREAARILQSVWSPAGADAVHDAETDSLLACANQFLKKGDASGAQAIFQQLYDQEKADGIRQAAFRGVLLCAGHRRNALLTAAIAGNDAPSQGAALELASKIGGSSATAALTDVLPKIPPAVQIALLRALGRRHDRSAAPAIAKMIDSPDPDVRLAAIAALDDLRDGSVALLLARTAAGASGATRAAARQALDDLRPGQVTSTLLKALPQAGPGVQAEIIRALGERGDSSAAPKLLELAGGKDESIRSASLQGLALLARPAEIPGMVRLVVTATNEDARSEAADALSSACQHMESQNGKMDATTLVQAVQTGPIDARIALLGVCSGVSDPQVRDALRAARGDHDERVRRAALRALLNSQDVEFLPDILGIARGELKNSHFRILGIRACVRLITQEQAAPLPVAQKIDTLKILQNINTDDAGEQLEAKRLVLSGLASVPDVQTLDMAVSMLDAADVRVEAGDATVKIARAISKDHPRKASAALKRVLAESPEGDVHKSAQAALKKIKPVE